VGGDKGELTSVCEKKLTTREDEADYVGKKNFEEANFVVVGWVEEVCKEDVSAEVS